MKHHALLLATCAAGTLAFSPACHTTRLASNVASRRSPVSPLRNSPEGGDEAPVELTEEEKEKVGNLVAGEFVRAVGRDEFDRAFIISWT